MATLLLVIACACSSRAPEQPSQGKGATDPPDVAATVSTEGMCARLGAKFSWVLPVRPDYSDDAWRVEDAVEAVDEEMADVGDLQTSDGASLSAYLEELQRFAGLFGDPSIEGDPAQIQLRYSAIMEGIYRVYEQAEAANLPSDCSFELAEDEASRIRFQGEAAPVCLSAKEKINAAPAELAQGAGTKLERFAELQRRFGQVYVELSTRLSTLVPPKGDEDIEALVAAYRAAGEARIENGDGLDERDDAKMTAADARFERFNQRATRLVEELELPFCSNLLRD